MDDLQIPHRARRPPRGRRRRGPHAARRSPLVREYGEAIVIAVLLALVIRHVRRPGVHDPVRAP